MSANVPGRRRHGQSKAKVGASAGTQIQIQIEDQSKPRSVTVAALKRAVEGRDAQALADMYADDAVMLVIDHDNPPSSPRRLAGKAAISSYFGDVCGRDMTHLIEIAIATGNRLAFTQSCTYPDGTKVFCSAMLDLKGGRIARQTVIQAWDR
ncbi:MAG TPA: nuclear transport factor 2 family protein [Xanthobacteraceae bacterium]